MHPYLNKANRPTMRPQRFGSGGAGGGGGGSGVVSLGMILCLQIQLNPGLTDFKGP